MRASTMIAAVALPVLLAAPDASAQRLPHTLDTRVEVPVVADTASIYSLPLPGQPPELGNLVRAEPDQQLQRDVSPTPFVIGGAAVGLFAGGVFGYATCVTGDGDCSAFLRMAAGAAIGTFMGAVLWLGMAPQP